MSNQPRRPSTSIPAPRTPRSPLHPHRWNLDHTGQLNNLVRAIRRDPRFRSPFTDRLYCRVGAEGDNYEGTSLLRPAYKPWWIKDKIERLDAIGNEREATGLPVVFPPQTADDSILDDLEGKLAKIRAGEVGYLIMPGPEAGSMDDGSAGWSFRVEGLGGSAARDALKSLEYHRDAISSAFVAEFMRLGQGTSSVGASATADVQPRPCIAACEALAATVEDEVNSVPMSPVRRRQLRHRRPPAPLDGLLDSTSLWPSRSSAASTAGSLHRRPAESFPAREHRPADPETTTPQTTGGPTKEAAAAAAEQGAVAPPDPAAQPAKNHEDHAETARLAGRRRATVEKVRQLDIPQPPSNSTTCRCPHLLDQAPDRFAAHLAGTVAQLAAESTRADQPLKTPPELIDSIAAELDTYTDAGAASVEA